MSRISKTVINGIESTFLQKEKYLPFEECVVCKSLKISGSEGKRNLSIHKYIPLRYLLVLLKEQMLILKKVASWEDPYENFFLKQFFVQPGRVLNGPFVSIENATKGIYGMSWTLQGETDSLWRIYSPDKMSVRISTTVEALAETVCSEDDKWGVWMNDVKYKSEEKLNQWLSKCKKITRYKQFVNKINKSFFIKRDAFSAEKEYRLIINYFTKPPRSTVCLSCAPNKLITSYLIDPRVNKYEYEAIKSSLMALGVREDKISKSALYDFRPQRIEMSYDPFLDF